MQFNYLPPLRAKLALNKGDASGAIQGLGAAVPYEFGATRAIDLDWTAMFPVFVRGEAYLDAHRVARLPAVPEDPRSPRTRPQQPIGALAHLGLGRAYMLQGDIPKAKAIYQDLLTLWKDAHPDIPVLRQAKPEYTKLQ